MQDKRGFILLMVVIVIVMLSSNMIWVASLQIQEMKVLNAAISRLHLDAMFERKITEISGVLSENAPVWFNHGTVFCCVEKDDG